MNKILLLVGICLISLANCEKRFYNNYTVFRLLPNSAEQLKVLHDLVENGQYDFWTFPRSVNSSVDVLVSPENINEFYQLLKNHQIKTTTMIDNLQKLINEEENELKNRVNRDYFDKYQRLSEIYNFLKQIASQTPDLAEVQSIGKTTQNRDMLLIKLGVKSQSPKKAIWIDGGIHAREWISVATVSYIVQELVNGYQSNNKEVVQLLTAFDWYFLPVSNPDGYEHTHTNDRMWRKTRSKSSSSSCYGADPNRNFGYKWGTGGSSSSPCSETYMGAQPFSEPETAAMRDAINRINGANKDVIKLYIAVHSYSQLWLYPWGWTSALTPDDDHLNEKANIAVKALSAVSGTRYDIGTSTNVLYVASGGADDWAYGDAKIKYSYTVELRDTGYYGFVLPTSYIKPSGQETFAGVKAIAQAIARENNLI